MNNLIESLQSLEIKLQTSSFTPVVYNWFCTSTSKAKLRASVGYGSGGRGFTWLLLQTWSNSHLPDAPIIPATTISIHGNAIDLLYYQVATWGEQNEIIKFSFYILPQVLMKNVQTA